jgi:PAS domain S-box-containing protein
MCERKAIPLTVGGPVNALLQRSGAGRSQSDWRLPVTDIKLFNARSGTAKAEAVRVTAEASGDRAPDIISLKTNWKIGASLAGATLLVVLVTVASIWAFMQVDRAAEARKQTQKAIAQAYELMSALRDAETGTRGYALTGNETFLEPYVPGSNRVAGMVEELRRLSARGDGRGQLDALAPLVAARMTDLASAIALRRTGDMRAVLAAVGSGRGKSLMDSIRAEIGAFVAIEQATLSRDEQASKSNMRSLFALIVGASVLTLLFALSFAYFLYRETSHRLETRAHGLTKRLLESQEDANRQLQTANASLRVSEELLAVTLDSIGDAVVTTDAAGKVTSLNAAAAQLTGWATVEAVGCEVGDVVHIINQETRQPAVMPVVDALAMGTIQGLSNHTVLIARDGSERAIADSCAPIRALSGEIVGAVLVFRDVTNEYAVQQALRDSAARINAILRTIGDGMITSDAGGSVIETVNPAAERMFGYSAEELSGQDFNLLLPELGRDRPNGSFEQFSVGAEAVPDNSGREVNGRRKDGSTVSLEIVGSEMWLGGKRHFTAVLRDVTARRRIESERNDALALAEKASLAKSDFLSSMSHELRTPLNAILGFAQLLESGSPPPTPVQKRSIVQILQAGWYLLELINEILDLALIESGKVTLSHEAVSLAEVMLECRAMIEPQAQKRGIKLTLPSFASDRFVGADRTRLKQVLINLLFNAVKYNSPEGTVAVEYTEEVPHMIRIGVRDTGMGLTAAQMGQLFQPFNRLGRDVTAEEGTGIGLVVTKRLVERMGGTIGVESTVGVGSLFWVEFGLATAPRLSASAPGAVALERARAPTGTPPRTLLYVEDNPANLELVQQLIDRRADLRLLSAADGELGIDFTRAFKPDVILMDINLPGLSGLAAMKILRADPATAHIPIIALSANAVPRDIALCLEAGFCSYLTKPIKVSDFMDTLDRALNAATVASAVTVTASAAVAMTAAGAAPMVSQ